MDLDVNTLFMVTMHVEIMLGLLLFFAWAQNFSKRALAWWGSAHLMRAISIMLFGMHGSVPDSLSIDLANAVLFALLRADLVRRAGVRPAHAGAGVRAGRRRGLAAGLPPAGASSDIGRTAHAGRLGDRDRPTLWLAAYEFWRGRDEALVSRWPAIFMLFAHGALFLLRTPLGAAVARRARQQSGDERLARAAQPRGAAVHDLDRLHPAGHGQGAHRVPPPRRRPHRSAHRHRQPPRLPRADRGVASAPRRARSPPRCCCSISIISRPINDRYGHAVGDRALQIFADTAQAHIGAAGTVGRWGGDEFVAVLYDTSARASRRRWPSASRSPSRRRPPTSTAAWCCATVSTGMVFSADGAVRTAGAAAAGRPGALSRQDRGPQPARHRAPKLRWRRRAGEQRRAARPPHRRLNSREPRRFHRPASCTQGPPCARISTLRPGGEPTLRSPESHHVSL